MSATHLIERIGMDGLDKLIEEGKVKRVSTHQYFTNVECENCNWNIIGDQSHNDEMTQQASRHNMITNHRVHVQAMQCYDLRFNEIVRLHEYLETKHDSNKQIIGQPTQSFYLNSDVKQGKMNLLCTNGTARSSKIVDLECGYDGIVGIVQEWTDWHGLKDDHPDSYITRQMLIIASLSRLEITVKVKGTSITFETLRG